MIDIGVLGVIAGASNIRWSRENPPYTRDDFISMYPQFAGKDETGTNVVPETALEAFVKLAHAAISARRYREYWEIAMGLFIAHWTTLYLQTAQGNDQDTSDLVNAGLAKGMQTSKSAGDLSVSYDFSSVTQDFNGWGTYKYTSYGQQFVTIARLVSMGGMTVW